MSQRIFAVVPAAGHSARMGRPKLSLPLGERTVIEWTVGALRAIQPIEILVVTAPHTSELDSLARLAGAHVLRLCSATVDMRATVEHGLVWIEQQFHPQPGELWLLCPADYPVVSSSALAELHNTAISEPSGDKSIWVPYCNGRGHPTMARWRHVAQIRDLPATLGLNHYFRQHAAETVEVAVSCESVLLDLDAPEDYAKLQELVASGKITPPRRSP